MKINHPTCGICNRPVDKVTVEAPGGSALVSFYYDCHGCRWVYDTSHEMVMEGDLGPLVVFSRSHGGRFAGKTRVESVEILMRAKESALPPLVRRQGLLYELEAHGEGTDLVHHHDGPTSQRERAAAVYGALASPRLDPVRGGRERGPSAVATAGGYIPRRLKDLIVLGPDMYGDDVSD